MAGFKQLVSAGGDGLVKVWTIRSGECETTLDNHTDRVWSLALTENENVLVSGGGDSVITFWQDTTALEKEKQAKALEERVEKYDTFLDKTNHQGTRSCELCAEEGLAERYYYGHVVRSTLSAAESIQ
jgi:U3 small nucleolar RNA-associated protein 13